MARVASILAREYGTPDLGNLPDPVDEAVYILLTYQTDVPRARQVWSDLKARFADWDAVLAATAEELEAVLKPAGFQRSRARAIRRLLGAVRDRFGSISLDGLSEIGDAEAEERLRELPGLDIKGARCVLLYAFSRRVLPVDSNTFRFMQRYGVLRRHVRFRRKAVHDGIQQLVPPSCRYTLHVNLVVHGQRTCLPRGPRCGQCVLRRSCVTGRRFPNG
jgi:endonuclease III